MSDRTHEELVPAVATTLTAHRGTAVLAGRAPHRWDQGKQLAAAAGPVVLPLTALTVVGGVASRTSGGPIS
ncbi:hypothetical protein ACIHCQ_44035 [Streptomyces sp. NPDC052236]|uniref:hypothetical protein n=1 Tax=Streptomyces sp. NPDC052236 TaxID=3365686 RepID=UPI0037D0211F